MGEGVFYGCTGLTEVTILSGIKDLPDDTFYNCPSLTTVKLPEGLTSIGHEAFYGNTSLTGITLPSTLTAIGDYAFALDEKIGPNLVIPEGVVSIGFGTFMYCYNIESITLPKSLQSIGDYALVGCISLNNLEFPDHLTHLSIGLLMHCFALTTCHLPAQLESIDMGLFHNTGITKLDIPDRVASIGGWAFSSCQSLKELTLPASVTELADSVFINGTKLDKLILRGSAPPIVTEVTFDEDDYTTTVIVPKGAGDAYRRHDIWGRFATIKEE